jgi:hypothetical protein
MLFVYYWLDEKFFSLARSQVDVFLPHPRYPLVRVPSTPLSDRTSTHYLEPIWLQ